MSASAENLVVGNSGKLQSCNLRSCAVLMLTASILLLLGGCHFRGRLPDKGSKTYADYLSTFYVGLAALQVGDDVRAESSLADAVKLVPAEPSAWANWGILALRQGNFDAAAQRLNHAHELAPDNDRLFYLLGILESNRGNSAASITNLREAIRLNPGNLRATYQLALEIERQGSGNSEADFQQLIQQILASRPDNLAALLELSRIAAKRGDTATLRFAVAHIAAQSAPWPPEVRQQLTALQVAATATPPTAAALRSVFLRNALMQVPEFRQSLALLKAAPGEEAEPFQRFLKLSAPVFQPAPPDTAMHFDPQPLAHPAAQNWDWIGAISLSGA